jgi:hypothetical protein
LLDLKFKKLRPFWRTFDLKILGCKSKKSRLNYKNNQVQKKKISSKKKNPNISKKENKRVRLRKVVETRTCEKKV